MNAQTGGPPDPLPAATPAELAERLQELRSWAGRPSLRRLRGLAGSRPTVNGDGEIDALPESTTSYVLRGDRPASAEFVRSFVTACLRARERDPKEIAALVELWHEAWLAAAESIDPPPVDPAADVRPQPTEPMADPGPEPVQPATTAPSGGQPRVGPVPRQLPATAAGFTGRPRELTALARLKVDGPPAGAVPAQISVVSGPAGVGKTTLAIHAAHQMADQFPDGQLFLNLHGFTAATAPVAPTDALDRLLRALGVPGQRIPAEVDDRAALWRTVLTGRRMLILLDNAATEEQVTPLLPGVPGCLVLITSRRRLAALAPALPLSLDVLPAADAVAMFTHAAGPAVATAPAELVDEAAELCGRLPLALHIAAARLRYHPSWHLADLVTRLRDQDRRLTELADDEGPRSVATALALSHQQLNADEQLLYQRLGLHPGPEVDSYAAAALLGTDPAQARRLLDRLRAAHLLQEAAPGRYTFHDLVRAHAATIGPGQRRIRGWYARRQQRAALKRLLDYYHHMTSVAMDTAYPYERAQRPAVPPARTQVPDMPDPAAAIEWLDTELPNLRASVRCAAGAGQPEYTSLLATTLNRHLHTRGHYHDADNLYHLALTTARAHRHRVGQMHALIGLGLTSMVLGRFTQARDCLHRGWKLARATADRQAELKALLGLGDLDRMQGRYGPAADRLRSALAIARDTGDRSGEVQVLRGFGEIDLIQGRHKAAVDNLERARDVARDTGNPYGELNALLVLGEAHRLQCQLEPARQDYRHAWDIARASGTRYGELNALRGLGHVYRMQKCLQEARTSLHAALEIARADGIRHGELGTLLALGHVHRQERQLESAADCYQQVLDTAAEIDDLNWQFEACHGLGRLHHAAGRHDLAVEHHQQALELAAKLEQPADEARAHDGLGHAHRALGQLPQARRHWQQALSILADLGTDYTEDEEASAPAISAHLTELDRS